MYVIHQINKFDWVIIDFVVCWLKMYCVEWNYSAFISITLSKCLKLTKVRLNVVMFFFSLSQQSATSHDCFQVKDSCIRPPYLTSTLHQYKHLIHFSYTLVIWSGRRQNDAGIKLGSDHERSKQHRWCECPDDALLFQTGKHRVQGGHEKVCRLLSADRTFRSTMSSCLHTTFLVNNLKF